MHPETMAGHPEPHPAGRRDGQGVPREAASSSTRSTLFDMLRKYTKIAREIDAPMPERLEAMLRGDGGHREGDGSGTPCRPSPATTTCCRENFIIDADGKMWIIDWEYGGMTDPYFDLGDFVMEHPFSRDEERLIIETYCGGMDEQLLRPHDALQERLRRVVGRVGDDPAHGLADRLRLHGVGHGARRARRERSSTTPTTSSGWRHSDKSTRVRGERGHGVKVRLFFATDVHGSEVCWRKFINSGQALRGRRPHPRRRHDRQGDRADRPDRARAVALPHAGHHARAAAARTSSPRPSVSSGPRLLPRRHDARGARRVHERRGQARRAVPRADAQDGRGVGRVGRREARGQRHPVHRLPRQRRPPTTSTRSSRPPSTSRWARATSSTCPRATSWSPAAGPTSRRGTPRARRTSRKLKERIMGIVKQATVPPERLVLGLHAPPYDTQLDVAPKIDWETLTVQGQDSAHVGSTAVKEVIEEVQPHPVAARAHPREPGGRAHRPHARHQPGQLVRRRHARRASSSTSTARTSCKRYRLTSG